VFGGFGLDAAEACAPTSNSARRRCPRRSNLVDKSMVQLVDDQLRATASSKHSASSGATTSGRTSRPRYAHVTPAGISALPSTRPTCSPARTRPSPSGRSTATSTTWAAHAWSIEHGEIDIAVPLVAALRAVLLPRHARRDHQLGRRRRRAARCERTRGRRHRHDGVRTLCVRGDLEGAIALRRSCGCRGDAAGTDCEGSPNALANAGSTGASARGTGGWTA
jgi:hypothetical protein